MSTNTSDKSLADLLRCRSKNLEEHKYVTTQIKAIAADLASLARYLESDPEYGFDSEAVRESVSILSEKQRRSRVLRTEITEANTALQAMDIPLSGI